MVVGRAGRGEGAPLGGAGQCLIQLPDPDRALPQIYYFPHNHSQQLVWPSFHFHQLVQIVLGTLFDKSEWRPTAVCLLKKEEANSMSFIPSIWSLLKYIVILLAESARTGLNVLCQFWTTLWFQYIQGHFLGGADGAPTTAARGRREATGKVHF